MKFGAFLLGCSLGLLATASQAATVDLRVLQDDGRPLAGQRVQLRLERSSLPLDQSLTYWRRQAALGQWQTLDSSGKHRFEDLHPGTYTVELELRGSRWIRPDRHPLRPPPTFTVNDADETLSLDVAVSEGVPVHISLDLPVEANGFTAILRHPASGVSRQVPLRGDGSASRGLLPRGIWEVEVVAPQGFLLVEILEDRQPWMGRQVVLDLVTDVDSKDLVFAFSASVEVEGLVSVRQRFPPSVQIQATLLEAGPWRANAEARGIDIPQVVMASLDEHDRFHLWLPEGRWQLEPVGEALLASEPQTLVRDLPSGSYLRADFTIEIEPPEEDDPNRLQVVVRDQHGKRLEGAVGAVVAGHDPSEANASTVWQGKAESGVLSVLGLDAGDYLVLAGHREHLAGHRVVVHDPDNPPENLAEIFLDQGALVDLKASSADSRRLGGMELIVERLDALPKIRLDDESFLDAKRRRVLTSDLAGNAQASGFYAGRYRIHAQLAGERRAMGISEVRVGGAWQLSLDVDLGSGEQLRVEARERPAARITARLQCSDRWELPETVDVAVFEAFELDDPPLFSVEALTLGGKRRDELLIGPLDAATVIIGFQPEGFERRTWVYGAATPEEAEALSIETGDRDARRAIDLGPLQVECGPAVDFWLDVNDGGPFPPVDELRMSAVARSQATDQPLIELELRPLVDLIEVRGMPRGEQVLAVTLEHPWFLPTPELTWEIPIELERGMFKELLLETEALGGAIELLGLGDRAHVEYVRARSSRIDAVIVSPSVPVLRGRALIPSLPPGDWILEACNEPECTKAEVLEAETLEESLGFVLISRRQTVRVNL